MCVCVWKVWSVWLTFGFHFHLGWFVSFPNELQEAFSVSHFGHSQANKSRFRQLQQIFATHVIVHKNIQILCKPVKPNPHFYILKRPVGHSYVIRNTYTDALENSHREARKERKKEREQTFFQAAIQPWGWQRANETDDLLSISKSGHAHGQQRVIIQLCQFLSINCRDTEDILDLMKRGLKVKPFQNFINTPLNYIFNKAEWLLVTAQLKGTSVALTFLAENRLFKSSLVHP